MAADNEFRIMARQRGFENFTFEKEGQWTGPFTFIQSADTQMGMIDDWVNKNHEHPTVEPEIILTNQAIDAINKMNPRPRFMVVCGDLTDAWPQKQHKQEQIDAFKQCFKRLNSDIKLVCVCGNHDVGDHPTPWSVEEYRRNYGDDFFSFWVGGVKFVVLNSQFYLDDTEVKRYRNDQDTWLDETLRRNSNQNWKHLVGFQHVAPFLRTFDEELVRVPPGTGALPSKMTFNFPMTERLPFVTKLKQAGMKKLFCGHYHRNAGGWDGDFEVIVTTAIGMQLGDDKSGLRVVKVLDNDITHEYFPLENIPAEVKF